MNNTEKTPGWWKSTFSYTCPRCRKGKLFVEPFKLSEPLNMHSHCDHCGLNYAPEPGYYWGAMFLSYAISGWALLLICLALVFWYGWSVESAMLVVIGIGVLTYFKLMRFSRSLYVHLLVRFDPDAAKKQERLSE